jgi:hypothetical protein
VKADILKWYCAERCYNSRCKEDKCEHYKQLSAHLDALIDATVDSISTDEFNGRSSEDTSFEDGYNVAMNKVAREILDIKEEK